MLRLDPRAMVIGERLSTWTTNIHVADLWPEPQEHYFVLFLGEVAAIDLIEKYFPGGSKKPGLASQVAGLIFSTILINDQRWLVDVKHLKTVTDPEQFVGPYPSSTATVKKSS